MNYKVKKAFKDSKKYLIVFLILYIILELLLIAPIAVAIMQNTDIDGKIAISGTIESFMKEAGSLTSVTRIAKYNAGNTFLKSSIWFAILFLFLTVIGVMKAKPKNEYKDIENGSSGWSEGGEQYKILNRNKGIILAENNYLPTDKRGNVNVLVVGGSGSGKSASYSIPNATQMLGSYVFTDPKGELYDKTAGFLQKNGYDIKVLNLVNPENSEGYNPLMHITNEVDVDVIAHTIVKGQQGEAGGSDPFWDDTAEMLLKALIYYLLATRPPEEQNLASCAELVRAANSNGGSNLLTDLMNELPYDHPARMNYKSIEIASDKTYSSILSTLQSKLGKFDSKEIAEVTSTNTINFEDIATRKTAVYVISSDTHTAYNFLLTIFFSQMIQQLYNFADRNPNGELKVPVFFILDEFANIGQIPDFDKKISTSRSRKISFSVILQNLDQLKAIYDKSYETIIGNCDTHVFLGSNSAETCKYFSEQLGETTISRDSKSVSRDKNYSKQGYSTSDQIMGRALMTPDELRRMDNDLCIIFEKGLKPIKAKKYYYFTRPIARRLQEYTISHNNFDAGNRGAWRKFNPANPYSENTEGTKEQDLKVESLDDLFEDDFSNNSKIDNKPEMPKFEPVNSYSSDISPMQNMGSSDVQYGAMSNMANSVVPPRPMQSMTNSVENAGKMQNRVNSTAQTRPIQNKMEEAPVLPMEPNNEEEELFSKDLQDELEAKFDELFGPIDNNKK